MKVFIDFDDVLFNTKEFKKKLVTIFKDNGVTEKQYSEERYWDGKYNLRKQIKSLGDKYKVDTEKLTVEVDNFFKEIEKYVFSDVQTFLERIGRENLFLVSFGDNKTQWRKIENAGVSKYFKEIIVTANKPEAIKRILKNESVEMEDIYFLDDRSEYLKEVKEEISDINTILVSRPEGRYDDEPNSSTKWKIYNLEKIPWGDNV